MKKKRKLKKGTKLVFVLIFISAALVTGIYILNNKKELNTNKTNNEVIEEENEEIAKVLKDNNLDFKVDKKYEELFKKYSEVVENNQNIAKYKKYIYNMFQVLMDDNINKYINESFFLDRLANLTIEVNSSISDVGVGGYYYDGGSPLIEIDKEYSETLYHELMHFLDFCINPGFGEPLWLCNGKVYLNHDYENLEESIQGKCEYLEAEEAEFIKEAGAEIYSAKYFKKGVSAYFNLTSYLTAMEYILGSDEIDRLFLSNNTSLDYMKLMLDNGFTLDEYKEIVEDLSYYTYPTDHINHKESGKISDSLIELYKRNIKNKDWKEDEEFKYILSSFLDTGYDAKYKNSKYKNDLDKIVYESFDDILKREKDMFDQIPDNIEFNNTPIPPYIINNELYLGSRIKVDGKTADNTFGYIKYDFNTKKIVYSNYSYQAE